MPLDELINKVNKAVEKGDESVMDAHTLHWIQYYLYALKHENGVNPDYKTQQKMWEALWAEEDNLEKLYAMSSKHNDWFMVWRPWLQRGFELAMRVYVESTEGGKE